MSKDKKRAVLFPPSWLEQKNFASDEANKAVATLLQLKYFEISNAKERAKVWRKALPSNKILDSIWQDDAMQNIKEELFIRSVLPKKLEKIFNDIKEKGPHRVNAKEKHLKKLSSLIYAEADLKAEKSNDYELQILCNALINII